MEWIKVSEPPKEDCEVPVKVYNYELETELYRIGIFQRGKWVIRDQYKREDVIAWLDESQPSLTLQQGLDIWDAAQQIGIDVSTGRIRTTQPDKASYFKSIGIDIDKLKQSK